MEDMKKDIANLYSNSNKNTNDIVALNGRCNHIDDRLDQYERTLEEKIETAVKIGTLEAMAEQAKDYKENVKWKDRAIIGFVITILVYVITNYALNF